MDDDPFGLFGAPKPFSQPPLPKTVPAGDQVMEDKETSVSSTVEGPSLGHTPSPFVPSPAPSSKPVLPTSAPNKLVLESLGKEVKPQPESSASEPPEPSLFVPPSYGEVPLSEPLPQTTHHSSHPNFLIVIKQWLRFYFYKLIGVLEPAAKKLRVPAGVLAVLVLILAAGAVWGISLLIPAGSVKLVDSIPPLHVVEVAANQISEMDITAYTEFQNQLQTMGFNDILECTLPQLPNTNFMEVGMKPDVGTYSEIIKFPGTINPKVSFVTTFTNGIWFSTNGWTGTSQENSWQVSEFFPDTPVDQLYVKHVQRVQQMISDNGWQTQAMSENRYLAALSDQVRTFLSTKKVPAYQAQFPLWH